MSESIVVRSLRQRLRFIYSSLEKEQTETDDEGRMVCQGSVVGTLELSGRLPVFWVVDDGIAKILRLVLD